LLAQIRTLSFYVVRPTVSAPVLDGRLDDEAWQNVPVHNAYYEYAKPDPGPGKLKTSFMMTYDERGLYVGIVNYEEQMDKIRQNVHAQDDPRLWTDDCAELYFDPEATATGFTKFTVNSLGVKADMRKLDMAVFLDDWSGSGWQVNTSLNEKDWKIEAFFPWEDLNRKPAVGELWMFVHTRYGWVNGFVGVSSSSGGGYLAPDRFGYLYFAGKDEVLNSQHIAEILTSHTYAPWLLALGSDLISNLGGRTQISGLDWEVRQARANFNRTLLEVKLLQPDAKTQAELQTIEAKSAEYQAADLSTWLGLQDLSGQLTDMKWKRLLEANFK
jgi:hypothetical protein